MRARLFDRNGGLIRQEPKHLHVSSTEWHAAILVEELEHPDCLLIVNQRNTQDRLRPIADALRNVGRVPGIALGVRNCNWLTADRNQTRDPMTEWHADLFNRLGC